MMTTAIFPDLAGRAVLITGGGSGIGAATARELAAGGARVAVVDWDEDAARAVATEIDGIALRADVSNRQDVEAAVAAAAERFERLDILCNNAGIGCFGATPDVDPADWERVIAIDLNAIFYACRVAIPLLARQGGAIVNTASISGLAADYSFTAYNAAKAAAINYTRALAIDHAAAGIRVNAVCPGLIATPLTGALTTQEELRRVYLDTIPMGRAGTPEEIARVIAFLASADASFMTGSIVVVDGGATAHTGQPNLTRYMSPAAGA